MQKLKGIAPIKIPKSIPIKEYVDLETEKMHQVVDRYKSYSDRLSFIKLYKHAISKMIKELSNNELKMLLALADVLDANKSTIVDFREKVMSICDWEHSVIFYKAQKGLIDKGYLIKEKRGVYQINANVIFNGVRIKT